MIGLLFIFRIPFSRAKELAKQFKITDILHPLFLEDPEVYFQNLKQQQQSSSSNSPLESSSKKKEKKKKADDLIFFLV